jgi:UPF0755 protein
MTEKFMKLSDFLKLIKKEDEQEADGGSEKTGTELDSAAGKHGGRIDISGAANVLDKKDGETGKDSGSETYPLKKKDISDEELASILSYFGWNAAEKTAGKPVIPPSRQEEAFSKLLEKEKPEPPKLKGRIFSGLDSGVIKEIFTQDELEELSRSETHVFTENDVKTITGKTPHLKAGRKAAENAGSSNTLIEDESGEYSPVSRRRYYRTGCLGGILYFGFIVCLSVILCAFAWMAADDVLSLNKEPATADIYVGEEKDISQVATELKSKGIIEYKWLFRLFAKISHASEKIDAGVYTVSSQLDYRAIITKLQQDTGWSGNERETVSVLIPEGKTLTQTFQILSDAGVCAYETLIDCAQNYNFEYDFLSEVKSDAEYKLEGYLFPDTYEFYLESEPAEAINKFLDNYEAKITDEMKAQAQAMGYSMNEIITIASLIEMEAGSDDERPTVASVIYNRLNSGYYPYLQIDATVQYALGERKEKLSYEDRLVESLYNTYLHEGLPPGPIANPGLASIKAALNPVTTTYYFYALNKEGTHAFFNDIDSFNIFLNSDQFGG